MCVHLAVWTPFFKISRTSQLTFRANLVPPDRSCYPTNYIKGLVEGAKDFFSPTDAHTGHCQTLKQKQLCLQEINRIPMVFIRPYGSKLVPLYAWQILAQFNIARLREVSTVSALSNIKVPFLIIFSCLIRNTLKRYSVSRCSVALLIALFRSINNIPGPKRPREGP